jgi:hypothetical protein
MISSITRSLSIVKKATISFFAFTCLSAIPCQAQQDDETNFKPSGKLWGLAYGDYAYKVKGDSVNRGGLNQYTGIKESESLFQFRRIYLGYDYNISARFQAEFLLSAEENETTSTTNTPTTTGDLLSDNKLAMFIKLANIKWRNIFRGSTLSVGELFTPSAVLLTEKIWDYRCIERTISDLRRTPAYDFGASLNGKLYNTRENEVGYNVMIGNGMGARPENDGFKWFYADVYTKLFDKHFILDIYADYNRLNWTGAWHHDRSMLKGLVAYTSPKFTIGVEAFWNSIMNDNKATKTDGKFDTLTTKSSAISVFARGKIYKDKLGFFARYDIYNPTYNNFNSHYTNYSPLTAAYNPNTKEQFITAGLDFTPIPKIHIMPNIWLMQYDNAGPVHHINDYDMVLRLSLYYVYGK